jgi:four helix bundle protein
MHNFREMKIWKEAVSLTKDIYQLTSLLPESEKFGLISQINRCAVSIPSNIAEGSSRNSEKEFQYFLSVAKGSCFELETQVIIAGELGLIENDTCDKYLEKIIHLQKMISNFSKQLIKTTQT